MLPLALTLHILGAPSIASPTADLRLVPSLRLGNLAALDPVPATPAAPRDLTNVHLIETLAGFGTYVGGEVIEGGLDVGFILLAITGGLSGGGNQQVGLLLIGIGGVILVTVAAWVGIPLVVAAVESGVAGALDVPANLMVGALGAFVGQSVGELISLGVLALAGGLAGSSSSSAGSSEVVGLLVTGLVIIPLCSAIGASVGLHLVAPGGTPPTTVRPTPQSAPPPSSPTPYSPPPEEVAPPAPPPLPGASPTAPPPSTMPVYPPSTFFMLPAIPFG